MDNPILYSDFIKPDSSVSGLIKQLEELLAIYTDMASKIKGEAAELEKTFKKVNNATSEGREATGKAAKSVDELAKAQEKLDKSSKDSAKELARLKLEQQKQNNINKLTAKLNKATEGSYDQLSAQYSLNKIRLNALSKEQRSNTKTGQDLEKQTAEIYEEMKRLQEATGKHTLSVGDYKKGWIGVKDELAGVPGVTGNVVGGFDSMSAAAKRFLANPIVLIVAAIVGGLALLFNQFKKTKAGSDLLTKGAAALEGVMSAITGVVDFLYKSLLRVFEDPQQALKDFWNALKQNLVNRLKGVLDLVNSLGKGIQALWNRDLDGLKSAAEEAGRSLIQMQTGLDTEQQKAFSSAIVEGTKAIRDQALAFAELAEARLATRRANRELEKQLEDLITKEQLAAAIADDATKSFKEREDAAASASQLTIQRAAIQKKIASDNLALINRELDLRQKNGEDVEELLDQQLDAYKTLQGAQRDYLLTVRDNQKRESELVQDRLERDLDILIDGFDNQKTINERIIADDSRTFAERRQVLDDTKKLFEDTFAKQIETIQQFTGVQVNANELISESDAVVLNQKIRALGLSEIIEGRLLEIVRERRTATQDLAEAEKSLTEAEVAAQQKAVDIRAQENKARYDAALEASDQEFELRMSEIDLLKETEAEKTKLRLEAEKKRLETILKLNQTTEAQLSKVQIETLKNTIRKIEGEIAAASTSSKDLYEALGINLTDDQKGAIAESTAFVASNIQQLLDLRLQAADAALAKAQEETEASKSRLEQEIEARNNGYANQVLQAQRELELNRRKEEQALKDKQKAQKAQERIDTLTQITGLITASVNIWKSLSGIPIIGPALAAVAVGAMFASFAASKIKAKQVAKEKLGDGGYEFLSGGSHASGNDIPIGTTKGGKQRTAEGGETLAVFKKSSTRKYRSVIPTIVNSINKGNFEQEFNRSFISDMPGIVNAGYDSPDLQTVEDELTTIRKQGEKKTWTDGNGRKVEQYRNVRRTYV